MMTYLPGLLWGPSVSKNTHDAVVCFNTRIAVRVEYIETKKYLKAAVPFDSCHELKNSFKQVNQKLSPSEKNVGSVPIIYRTHCSDSTQRLELLGLIEGSKDPNESIYQLFINIIILFYGVSDSYFIAILVLSWGW